MMLGAIRRALFGFNRDEQEAYLTQKIYRLSKWVEQTRQVELAARSTMARPKANPGFAELEETLASFDRAKSHVADGGALPRTEFNALRARISSFERTMDAAD
jgi:hypothetical protein